MLSEENWYMEKRWRQTQSSRWRQSSGYEQTPVDPFTGKGSQDSNHTPACAEVFLGSVLCEVGRAQPNMNCHMHQDSHLVGAVPLARIPASREWLPTCWQMKDRKPSLPLIQAHLHGVLLRPGPVDSTGNTTLKKAKVNYKTICHYKLQV